MDFSEIIKPGLEAEITETVMDKNIASIWGSGGLPVYATPCMIASMEKAALNSVAPFLPAPWSTVGTEVCIKHLSSTPRGMKITTRAKLLHIDGRALTFTVEAYDETGKIGEGTHGRFIIDEKKFMKKTEAKGGKT
ncbi:MAG: thioesterase family protein [Treponema sp.]|jgi:predicted thioesterase|nr:thioesterase family protein [Treponema sp.]